MVALMHSGKNLIRSEWVEFAIVLTHRSSEDYVYHIFQEIIMSLCKELASILSLLSENDSFTLDYPNIQEIISLIQECIRFLFARKNLAMPNESGKAISRSEAGGFRIFSGLIGVFSGDVESVQTDSSNNHVRFEILKLNMFQN